ncbi:serine O-acetyltransferase EpsC [Halapricum hydrolyticum]|uniref:serine O-acetyltransferase n=1 Tax=Halapricum hydrolyticum TaxID=2979991 RepID=A0AAE3IBB4_9EURY|nr:serine O-acetyltransferase EpsC [Halapricum hydrolyticum]MCU4718117.1 serine O-acetyltransferase [Halapricum hydrolyticum]MCU4727375.1 serine O-acetyltransferase [Halapricum hydrolyticum]
MKYEYTGDIHRELVESYRADESPFPTYSSRTYPRRDFLRDEPLLLKQLMFPRCWNATELLNDPDETRTHLTALGRCIQNGITAYSDHDEEVLTAIVDGTLDRLPAVRRALKKDVEAAYKGDPAAKSYCEIIRSYPGFHAIMSHRIAHILYEEDIFSYARELAEYTKTETGIDIHPGAEIGEYFFVDHGSGVVIGETTTVGDWVRIYQNVTLGALHFEEDEESEEHMLAKDYNRHPDIGDHVVIGAGSNVLGTIEIGDHVSIGANSWVTDDVPDNTSVFIADHPKQKQKSNR